MADENRLARLRALDVGQWPHRTRGVGVLAVVMVMIRCMWYLSAMTVVLLAVSVCVHVEIDMDEEDKRTVECASPRESTEKEEATRHEQRLSQRSLQRLSTSSGASWYAALDLRQASVKLTYPSDPCAHMVYTLTVKIDSDHGKSQYWTVLRAYHEFRELRKCLQLKSAPFPSKLPRMLQHRPICHELLKKRGQLLQSFMDEVLRHPELVNHIKTRQFLRPSPQQLERMEEGARLSLVELKEQERDKEWKYCSSFARLSAEQQRMVLRLRTTLLCGEKTGKSRELIVMTHPVWLVRFLACSNWSFNDAYVMLKETIEWRESIRASDLLQERRDLLFKEHETGKAYVADFWDLAGNSVLVCKPYLENTYDVTGNLINVVFNLERAIRFSNTGRVAVLVDLSSFSLRDAPPVKNVRQLLSAFQRHYVETLAYAVVYDAPWIFGSFYNLIKVVLDQDTQSKITFIKESESDKAIASSHCLIDPTHLHRHVGSSCSFKINLKTYLREGDSLAALHYGGDADVC